MIIYMSNNGTNRVVTTRGIAKAVINVSNVAKSAVSGSGGTGNYVITTPPATSNYTISTANYIILPDLTGQTNKIVNLPSGPTVGQPLIVRNLNGSLTAGWSFGNGVVFDSAINVVTALNNLTTYQMVWNGTTWDIIN